MRILITSDTHSNFKIIDKMIGETNPAILVHCGDWGCHMDDILAFDEFIKNSKIPVLSIYGNHDDVKTIKEAKAKMYRWLPNFNMVSFRGLKFMGINGNVAGRTRHPWHVTENIIREELHLCTFKPGIIDIVISHECPKGYADILRSFERDSSGRHKWKKNVGWESLFEVMQKIKPKFWFCGHIHYPQVAQWGKTMVYNAGSGVHGDYVLLDTTKDYQTYEWLSCLRRVKGINGPRDIDRLIKERCAKRKLN